MIVIKNPFPKLHSAPFKGIVHSDNTVNLLNRTESQMPMYLHSAILREHHRISLVAFVLQVMIDIDGQHEWRDCLDIPGVRLPKGYYFGATAITGDLSGKRLSWFQSHFKSFFSFATLDVNTCMNFMDLMCINIIVCCCLDALLIWDKQSLVEETNITDRSIDVYRYGSLSHCDSYVAIRFKLNELIMYVKSL